MDKTVVIHKSKPSRGWLGISSILFISIIAAAIGLATWRNTGSINHLLTPVMADLELFRLIWDNNPLGAMLFIANKSIISLAHHDARSGLNLWTLEYDTITLTIYLICALLTGKIIARALSSQSAFRGVLPGLAGMICLVLAVTYMTSIAHCAGPTWIGFVASYGLGFENFEHYPYWQIGLGITGIWLLSSAVRHTRKTAFQGTLSS